MLLDGLGWSHYSVFAPCIMTQTRVLGRSGGDIVHFPFRPAVPEEKKDSRVQDRKKRFMPMLLVKASAMRKI